MSSEQERREEAENRRYARRFFVGWLVASAVATPLVAIFLGPEMPPGDGSLQAAGQSLDGTVLASALTPVVLFVVGFVVFALRHFRAGGNVDDGPADHGNRRIQIAWVAVTAALVFVLASFGSYQLVRGGAGGGQGPSPAFLPKNHVSAMNVQVIAQQWMFTYRYPSYGGIETLHLVLPAHTLVRLNVTSLDVVHSFWAYQLGVKADANPGVNNVAYVQLRNPTSFSIRCAELCGLWHGYMFDTGHVVSKTAFAAWMKQQQRLFEPIKRYVPAYATSYLPQPVHRGG